MTPKDEDRLECCHCCRFFEPAGALDEGRCLRFPPVLIPELAKPLPGDEPDDYRDALYSRVDTMMPWFFPVTIGEHWCGEYRHDGMTDSERAARTNRPA